MTNIFQIDWILVDTIIIILLLLLLLVIKIFKITHRWRHTFSNEAIEYKYFSQLNGKAKNRILLTKKYCLTRNLTQKEGKLPIILIFRMNYKRTLLKVLTEGLSSYGFTVISIKAKIEHTSGSSEFEKTLVNEWKRLFSEIIKNFQLPDIKSSKFILISGSKDFFTFKHFLSDFDNLGAILINPRIYEKPNMAVFRKSYISPQIFSIFSRKSILFLKNKQLYKFLNDFSLQKDNKIKYLIIENATYSFKYYETILLGIIIDIIENKLLKSKI